MWAGVRHGSAPCRRRHSPVLAGRWGQRKPLPAVLPAGGRKPGSTGGAVRRGREACVPARQLSDRVASGAVRTALGAIGCGSWSRRPGGCRGRRGPGSAPRAISRPVNGAILRAGCKARGRVRQRGGRVRRRRPDGLGGPWRASWTLPWAAEPRPGRCRRRGRPRAHRRHRRAPGACAITSHGPGSRRPQRAYAGPLGAEGDPGHLGRRPGTARRVRPPRGASQVPTGVCGTRRRRRHRRIRAAPGRRPPARTAPAAPGGVASTDRRVRHLGGVAGTDGRVRHPGGGRRHGRECAAPGGVAGAAGCRDRGSACEAPDGAGPRNRRRGSGVRSVGGAGRGRPGVPPGGQTRRSTATTLPRMVASSPGIGS